MLKKEPGVEDCAVAVAAESERAEEAEEATWLAACGAAAVAKSAKSGWLFSISCSEYILGA